MFCVPSLRFNDKKLKRTTLNCSNVNFLKSCCLIYVSTLIFVYKYSLWKKKHNLYRMFDATCRIHVLRLDCHLSVGCNIMFSVGMPCADPESFVRGGPTFLQTLTTFFFSF